jgi:signal transduction histidine kinase
MTEVPSFVENNKRTWWQHFNFVGECRILHLRLWQCPAFLFLMIGFIDIVSMLGTYFIATSYQLEPELVALIVTIVSVVILIIGWAVNAAFNQVAESSRLKSEFVSIASHQLRTPLSNLKYALDFIVSGRAGNVDPKWLKQFHIIEESNERMIRLVNNLLDLSRIEAGKISLDKKGFDITKEAQILVNDVANLVEAYGIKLVFQVQGHIPRIITDPGRIRMVMQNFIDNAIKYSSTKGSEVKVEILTKNKRVIFQVTDQGVGIPKGDQKRIFQKFFRSGNVLKHQTDGTGLGLYIAKATIEAAGGKVGFSSEENKGSTFWFSLPIKDN